MVTLDWLMYMVAAAYKTGRELKKSVLGPASCDIL